LERPLKPVTRPPEDIEKSYLPSDDRLMVIGSLFETRRSLASSRGCSSGAGIVELRREFSAFSYKAHGEGVGSQGMKAEDCMMVGN
jgi:hypothetical protein